MLPRWGLCFPGEERGRVALLVTSWGCESWERDVYAVPTTGLPPSRCWCGKHRDDGSVRMGKQSRFLSERGSRCCCWNIWCSCNKSDCVFINRLHLQKYYCTLQWRCYIQVVQDNQSIRLLWKYNVHYMLWNTRSTNAVVTIIETVRRFTIVIIIHDNRVQNSPDFVIKMNPELGHIVSVLGLGKFVFQISLCLSGICIRGC